PFASPLAPHELKSCHATHMEGHAMTAVTHMDHDRDTPADYLAAILKEVKTIAMVGASSDPTKFSYGVLRVLHETGYDMIPVNPNEAGTEIRGLRVYESLARIGRPVDMVQVFRNSDALPEIAREAIAIGAKVLWAQLGVRNDGGARRGGGAGRRGVANARGGAAGGGGGPEGGHGPLSEDRALSSILEAAAEPADLNRCT